MYVSSVECEETSNIFYCNEGFSQEELSFFRTLKDNLREFFQNKERVNDHTLMSEHSAKEHNTSV